MKNTIIKTATMLALGATLSFAQTYATVDGYSITDKDFENVLRGIPGAPKSEDLSPDIKDKIMQQLVERRLLVKYALKNGIEKDKDYLEAMKILKDNLAVDVWVKKELDSTKVTDAEIKAFYEKAKVKLSQPEQVKARHILVEKEDEAKAIIAELLKEKKETLEDKFVSIAKDKSTGPSGKNGGDLGFFTADQMVKPFSDASFALNAGEITKEPVKTQFGYHVILVTEKKASQTTPFEEVKADMENGAKTDKFRASLQKKLDELKSKAKIEYTK